MVGMIVGIDVGLKGYAVLTRYDSDTRTLKVFESFPLAKFLNEKKEFSTAILPLFSLANTAVIERVWGRKTDGSKSAFRFGVLYGQIKFAVSLTVQNVFEYTPQRWRSIIQKKYRAKGKGKSLSVSLVEKLGYKPKRHDEADAICLVLAFLADNGKKVEKIKRD